MNTLVRRLGSGVIAGAIALAAIPASAQELTLGYQWQNLSSDDDEDLGFDCCNAPLGFNVDVAGPISPSLDIVGQVDWSRWNKSEVIFGTSADFTANFTTFGGGLRWSNRTNPGATPFVQALFGVMRSSFSCEVAGFDCEDLVGDDTSETDPMLQIGGGVAIPLGGWSAVGQVDYRRIFVEDAGVNGFRVVVGARFGIR